MCKSINKCPDKDNPVLDLMSVDLQKLKNKVTDLETGINRIDYNSQIYNIPKTFTPSKHTHKLEEVEGAVKEFEDIKATLVEFENEIQNGIAQSQGVPISVTGTVLPQGTNVPAVVTVQGVADLYGGATGRTYTQTGGASISVAVNKARKAFFNRATDIWTAGLEYDLPLGVDGRDITDWTAKVYQYVGGRGSLVFHNGGIYENSSNTNSNQIPGEAAVWIDKTNTLLRKNTFIYSVQDGYSIDSRGDLFYNYYTAGRSEFIRILSTNIKISNYTVLTANKITDTSYAEIFIYDEVFNYLGYLDSPVSVSNKTRELNILDFSLFPNAYYFRVNVNVGVNFNVTGADLLTKESLVNNTIHGKTGYSFDGFFVNKVTGQLEASAGYKATPLISYSGGDLIVSGFSGASNNAALLFFYDSYGKPISSYNTDVAAPVYNLKVKKDLIPAETSYIRSTATTPQFSKIQGFNLKIKNNPIELSKKTTIDINELNPTKSILTKAEARALVPLDYQKNGIIITYNLEYGRVTEQFKKTLSGFSVADDYWITAFDYSDSYYIDQLDGRIFNTSGGFSNGVQTNARSKYIRLQNLTIYNYSVLSANAVTDEFAAVFVYNEAFDFLGTLNESTAGTYKPKKVIVASDVTSKFFGAYYITVNVPIGKGFNVIGDTSIVALTQSYVDKNIHGTLFQESGFVSKTTGKDQPSAGYTRTPYLKYLGGNIVVSGYSGLTNDAGLLVMYNSKFEYIGSINHPSTNGLIYNYTISESLLNGCYYYRCTAGVSQVRRRVFGNFEIAFWSQLKDLALTPAGLPSNIFQLADKKRKINFENYLGNFENIHPKIIYFKNGWKGFKFWMAYTPYPSGATDAENPAIAVSNDGLNWSLPTGMENPLDFSFENGYNSDTHLVYREDLDRLEMFYRPYNYSISKNQIKRRFTTDGLNWSPIELIIDFTGEQMLSPAIIFEDGVYKWWWCLGSVVRYGESTETDPGNIINKKVLNIPLGTVSAWHLDVIKTELGYEYLIQGYVASAGGNNNASDMYYVLESAPGVFTAPKRIIKRSEVAGDFDERGIYRGCFFKANDAYFVYYSSLNMNWNRAMALKYGKDILNLE